MDTAEPSTEKLPDHLEVNCVVIFKLFCLMKMVKLLGSVPNKFQRFVRHKNNNHNNVKCGVEVNSFIRMSGWPSGLRRQTQVKYLSYQRIKEFWSSKEGVGSNPTSDKYFFMIDN